ncbi:MAG TPA: sigma-54 dependent transcriptional regulator [Bdellovibrionota bacterium]|nr:sigma-54 dependent transcriptional regulator [Bdellovibrionota bacterium]
MTPRKFLYVDDSLENLATLRRVLRGKYDVETETTGSAALSRLEGGEFALIVADQRMPEMTGVEFLKKALKKNPDRVGILLTAYTDLGPLVEGVNAGVIYRYLTKPWREPDLIQAIAQAFERYDLVIENRRLLAELERDNRYLKEEIAEQYDFSEIAGAAQGLKGVVAMISKVAPTSSSVLIRGESGVGKELVARAIHAAGPRREKPFVRVNCGSLAEGLLESELFGHEKGAFTGAVGRRIGRFEAADGGTLFLDEIGDISPKLQVNLLRILQEKEFERVGGNETIRVDVRVIAATHRDLEKMSKDGTFREDLYYRMNVFPIRVPPLRERMGDLTELTGRLLARAARNTGIPAKALSKSAMEKLKSYDWPGNVRELENVLERALILASADTIAPEDLVLGPGIDETVQAADASDLTKEQLEEAISVCGGNKVQAARKLGIKRPTLYYHLKRFGMN